MWRLLFIMRSKNHGVEKIFKTETGKKIVKEMFFPEAFQKSETWAQDALQDLEDFIEEQGIYIRQ